MKSGRSPWTYQPPDQTILGQTTIPTPGQTTTHPSPNCFDRITEVLENITLFNTMCHRAVSGIPSDGNRVGHGAIFVARKSYYDEEYSVYLCGQASSLSLMETKRQAV